MQLCIFRNKQWESNLQTEDCVLNCCESEWGGGGGEGWHSDKQHHMSSQCNVLEKNQATVFKSGSIKWYLR